MRRLLPLLLLAGCAYQVEPPTVAVWPVRLSAPSTTTTSLPTVEQVRATVDFDNLIRRRNAEAVAARRAAQVAVEPQPYTPSPVEGTVPSVASTTTTTAPPRSIEWRPSVERWRGLVAAYFQPADVEHALAIIRCESVGDPDATNPSSGTAGLFQHRPRYWPERSSRAGWTGADIYDPEANVAVAAWLVYDSSTGPDDPPPHWHHWSGRAWGVASCDEYACDQGVC